MARKSLRPRIDWLPGGAAQEGLRIARTLFPHLGTQEVIDKVFLTGLHTLRYGAPVFFGADRDAWQLPPGLTLPAAVPEIEIASPRERTQQVPEPLRDVVGRVHAARRNEPRKP